MITCYKSTPSKIIMLLGVISILISIYKSYNFKFIAIQSIIFYLLAFQSECQTYGGCNVTSWLTIVYPSIAIILFLMDQHNIFDPVREKIKIVYDKVQVLNNTAYQDIIEKEMTK
jgi:hypothetical protein